MKSFTPLLTLILLGVCTQARSTDFVTAANGFLDVEVPKMEAAVAAKDREYFRSGIRRVQEFVDANWANLDKFPPCTEAVTDFLIVGLCRISTPGSICEPGTFIPKFEDNLAKCRAAAKAKPAFQRTPLGAVEFLPRALK
jgi:hypothetical protein